MTSRADTAPANRPAIRSRAVPPAQAAQSSGQKRSSAASPFLETRRRLVFINLLVVAAILAVMAIAIYVVEARAADQQVNQQLQTWIATHPSIDDILHENHAPPGAAYGYSPSSPNIFPLVIAPQQSPPFIDPDNVSQYNIQPDWQSANQVMSGKQHSTLTTNSCCGHEFRLYTVPLYDNQGHIVGALQVGMSLDAREQQMHGLLLTLGSVGLGALLLTAIVSFYLAARALTPMRLAFDRQRQFTAAASHELRTPLAFLRSQSELVLRRLQRRSAASTNVASATAATATAAIATSAAPTASVEDGLTDDVREIVDEVDYMTRLVRDLLVLARDETDHRGLTWQTVDLSSLATEVAEKVRPSAEEHGLALTVDTDAAAPTGSVRVRGDADRLRQLALILLENAIHYTPSGGNVRIAIKNSAGPRLLAGHRGHAQLIVSDTGIGIAPDALPRIFEPFYRADAARTSKAAITEDHSSAGLGLALARWIVNAHGGTITANSTEGKGSTFTVTLPLAVGESVPQE